MSRKKNITDQVFKGKLKQYAESPPEEVWTGITGTIRQDRMRTRLAWVGRIAAAATILLAAGSVWILVQRMPDAQISREDTSNRVGNEAKLSENNAGQPGTGETMSNETGPDGAVSNETGSGEAMSNETGSGEAMSSETGTDKTMSGETGSEKTLSAETGPDQIFADNVPADGVRLESELTKAINPESNLAEAVLPAEVLAIRSGPDAKTGENFQAGGFRSDAALAGNTSEIRNKELPGLLEPRDGSRLDYSLPVGPMDAGLILAEEIPTKSRYRPEEDYSGGIDVFEEFGDEPANKYNRWAVGGQMTPLYSYRDLEGSSTDAAAYNSVASTASAINNLDQIENGVLSYAAGINLNYSPARKLSVQTGLYYSQMGLSVQNSYFATADGQVYRIDLPQVQVAITNSSGEIILGGAQSNGVLSNTVPSRAAFSDAHVLNEKLPEPEIQQGDLLQHFDYLEVPLILRYRLLDRRFGVNVLGGLSTNFLVGNNVYFESGSSREYIGTTGGIKPVNYSSVVGLGLQYSIVNNLNFNFEPTFRYYLNSINTGSLLNSHPYSMGFFTGVSYSF